MWLLTGYILVQLLLGIDSQDCRTSNDKPREHAWYQTNKPCIFPFIHDGKTYNSCGDVVLKGITHRDICATKVNNNNEIRGLGKCGPTITTNDGPSFYGKNKPCIFPFKNDGQIYNTCADIPKAGKVFRNVCATKLKSSGEIDQVGECSNSCPRNGGQTQSQPPPTTTTKTTTPQKLTRDNYKKFKRTISQDDGRYLFGDGRDACGRPASKGFIVGGEDAKTGELPFMVMLGYKKPGKRANDGIEYQCGGALINKRYVLTAAHCLDGSDAIAEVRLGVTDLNNEEGKETHQRIKITEDDTIVHEKWRGDVDIDSIIRDGYDIMLIRLPEPAILETENSEYLTRPACLPFREINKQTTPIQKNFVAGWGRTRSLDTNNAQGFVNSDAYTQNLQKLELSDVIEGSECATRFQGLGKKGVGENDGRVICARAEYVKDDPKDACSGDSGGPIYSSAGLNDQSDQKYLRGIVSIGSTKCGTITPPTRSGQKNKPSYGYVPGMYTKLEEYIPWILEKLKP